MRLIDADALAEMHRETCSDNMKFNLDLAPTVDATVVVHCGKCRNNRRTEFGKLYCSRPMGKTFGYIPVDDDDFCSGGKR